MRRAVRRSLRRPHRGLNGAAALTIFLVLVFLLGGIANAVPAVTGVVGFMTLVVALLCWIATGNSRRH